MLIYLTGGAKNGKTELGQELAIRLSGDDPRYYVAAMIPCDDEDRQRIARHRKEREGLSFVTLEWSGDIETEAISADRRGTYLFDSVTALLANEMFAFSGEPDADAGRRVTEGLLALADRAENCIFISDGIFSDAFLYDEITELYRRQLADIDRAMAAYCDEVWEVTAGRTVVLKGKGPDRFGCF